MDLVQGQLAFDGIPERLTRVTPAKLTTWSSCPRRYRFNYVDRPRPARGPAMAHTTLGAALHNALRALYELPPAQRTPSRGRELVNRHWKSEGFAGAEQSADYRVRAGDWVADYVERHGASAEPVGVERWVSATTGTIIVQGRVDRIDHRDGELVVVDYKAGRHTPGVGDARDSLALALYALATRSALHGRCRRVELHHLRTSEVVSWRHTADSLAEHRERAERLAHDSSAAATAVEAGEDPDRMFPARPGARCAACEFRRHCREGKRAVPEIEPWALLGE
ncbi:PD-(D/E)XK nuclease superfamily protein [Actinopolyspora xinjiangensis]|uniref:PD-(D/E)XK nuclease superfamily protein n=1 Tax=Actinopolyspora xinjiangensis TaxID=405564 RepID=A0A1H0VZ26_9ACTN|nr:PD-(D/E)XK nuclease superfamily protein [Actinopolyspora xinjiangensis]